LIIPGLASGRIHVVDTVDPRRPRMRKVIESKDVVGKAKLTGPHTVHCLADGRIMISMLGDENGDAPGGFLLLDDQFEVAGSWAASHEGMRYNYDFWYQPRYNVMVSSEWASLNTVRPGFKLEDVGAASLPIQQLLDGSEVDEGVMHRRLVARGDVVLLLIEHRDVVGGITIIGTKTYAKPFRWRLAR